MSDDPKSGPRKLTIDDWIVIAKQLFGTLGAIALAIFLLSELAPVGERLLTSYRCVPNVQADLDELQTTSVSDPKVEKCIGPSNNATCFVSLLSKGYRKTGPLQSWDCTVRHAPVGTRQFLADGQITPSVGPVTADALRKRFGEGATYVLQRFFALQESLEGK